MEVAKRIVIDPVTRACLEVDYPAAKTLKEAQTVHVHKGCLPWTLQEQETPVVGVGWKELPGRDRDYKCWACRGYLIEDPDEAAWSSNIPGGTLQFSDEMYRLCWAFLPGSSVTRLARLWA